MACCLYNMIISAAYSTYTMGNPKSVTINETVEFETSHAGGNIGPACRKMNTYDCTADVEFECIAGTGIPIPKSETNYSLVIGIESGIAGEGTPTAVTITLANMLVGAFSLNASQGSAASAKQQFVYNGDDWDFISIS